MTGQQQTPSDLYANQGPKIIIIAATFYGLAIAAVGSRLLARRISGAGLKWDDFAVLAAVILSTSSLVLPIVLVRRGLGRHIEIVELGDLQGLIQALEISMIFAFFYVIVLAVTRYSVLLFYWRIFHVPSFKLPLCVVTGIVTASFVANIITLALACIPLRAVWDLTVGGRCMNLDTIYLGNSVHSTALDAIILALPVPMLLRLHVGKAQKFGLLGVFALGGFTLIASILRLAAIFETQDGTKADVTWNRVNFAIWAIIELNIGIISACLPSMRPLLIAITNRLWSPTKVDASKHSVEQRPVPSSQDQRGWRAIRLPCTESVASLSENKDGPFDV